MDASKSIDEVVIVVDENNKEIGSAKRKEVREKNLWHRASFIFVYNNKGEFFC